MNLLRLFKGGLGKTIQSVGSVFKPNAEAHAQRKHTEAMTKLNQKHEITVKGLEHRKANFKYFLFQITALPFVFLFWIFFLSPLLAMLPFAGLNQLMSGYQVIFSTIGMNVVLMVLGSLLGINGLHTMVDKKRSDQALQTIREHSMRLDVENAKTNRLKEVTSIKAEGGDYSFEGCLNKLLKKEGGYANDPDDSGGETYKGISRNNWQTWKGWELIDKAKKQLGTGAAFKKALDEDETLSIEVADFYKEHFWNKLRCDEIHSGTIRNELFDTAVNMGIKPAVRFLQQAINICSKATNNNVLTVDGAFGEGTLNALDAITPRHAKAVHKMQNTYQAQHYVRLCETNSKNWKFFKGWISHRA